MPLPDDWQQTMVDMIRGSIPADGEWFTGGPVLSPVEQIEVYVDQYRMRILDAVWEEVPGLAHLLGDEVVPVLRGFIRDHPPNSYTLNDVANDLVDWLVAQDAPLAQVEMARLDRAVQKGFTAAEGHRIRAESLAVMPPLRLQPHVTLLRQTTNVHRVRSAVMAEAEDIPELEPWEGWLVVFRRGLRMRHWEVARGLWSLLDRIGRGEPVAAALDGLVRDGEVGPLELQRQIAGWFKDITERNLIEVDE